MYNGASFRKNDAMQQEQYCIAAVVRGGGGGPSLSCHRGIGQTSDVSRWRVGCIFRATEERVEERQLGGVSVLDEVAVD